MPAVNNPPPRPGFTRAVPQRTAPVVVSVTESATSIVALRRAADEAAQRSSPLHVIAGGPVEDALGSVVADDEREWHTLSWMLRGPHVTVSVVVDTSPEALAAYCKDVAAYLLVVGCDQSADHDDMESMKAAHRLVDVATCDVLVIHAPQQVGQAHS